MTMTMTKSQTPITLTAAELQTVGGGAAYIKFDGIDGESLRRSQPLGTSNFIFGDGSVKF